MELELVLIHVIRGGLNFNMELRWDGVPSLADALHMLRDRARRTPAPQWVRIIGGWTEFQFAAGSSWFSGEIGTKGCIAEGRYADLAVLSADFFSVPEDEIKGVEALMTIVDDSVVYGAGEFAIFAPPTFPVADSFRFRCH